MFEPEHILSMVDWRDNNYDLYPGYSRPLDSQEEHYFDSRTKALQYAKRIHDLFTGFHAVIPVYRAIRAPSEDAIDREEWGESWSFNRDSALEFGTHAHANFLVSGKVRRQDVDWETSLSRYVEFSSPDGTGEDEIVVPDSSQVFAVQVQHIRG
jgi:hypothetical protein